MYTAKVRPRALLLELAFSQLSITVASPAKHRPVGMRSSSHSQGSITRPWLSATIAVAAASTAKARIWPTRRIRCGERMQPMMVPTAAPVPSSPICSVLKFSSAARIGIRTPFRPPPTNRMAALSKSAVRLTGLAYCMVAERPASRSKPDCRKHPERPRIPRSRVSSIWSSWIWSGECVTCR